MHLFCRAQIVSFIANKILIGVFKESAEYTDVFTKEVTAELFKHTRINDHFIDLEKSK